MNNKFEKESFSHDYSILRRLAFFSLSFYLINIYTNLSFINQTYKKKKNKSKWKVFRKIKIVR